MKASGSCDWYTSSIVASIPTAKIIIAIDKEYPIIEFHTTTSTILVVIFPAQACGTRRNYVEARVFGGGVG